MSNFLEISNNNLEINSIFIALHPINNKKAFLKYPSLYISPDPIH